MISIARAASLFAFFCLVSACSSVEPDDTSTGNDEINTRRAREGQTCSSGTFGTPVINCESDLVCDFGKSTEPSGPDGAASATTGHCAKAE